MNGKGNVVLHIGLHKTGTRYLQRMVFRQLDAARFNVNPPHLWQPLRRAMREPDNAEPRERAEAEIQRWRASSDERTLVISEPHICGDMFSSYQDYAENLAWTRRLFPDARILLFVRDQGDWLQSAYRQHLVRGRAVPIETFLNFFDGEFRPRRARTVNGVRSLEALNLPFLDIYRRYAEAYGTGAVYLLRQEDLKRNRAAVEHRLAECLGIDRLPDPPTEKTQNRSYSALAIGLFHPSTLRHPRPLVEKGRAQPRHSPLRPVTGQLRRLRRVLIQHLFDRLIYVDRDLLARRGMRERIERHYAAENEQLREIAQTILDQGPGAVALERHTAAAPTAEPVREEGR